MLIYSTKKTNRLEYIFSTLLTQGFNLKLEFTNDEQLFKNATVSKLNYSNTQFENCIQIEPHSILFDYGVKDYSIEVINHPVYHKIFFKNSNNQIPFDLFGAAFWLISRYEEYLPHRTDNFNRFHYKSSLAYQYDFLKVPLVNLWLYELAKILKNTFPDLVLNERKYNYISSIDIDNAFMFKYKGFVRTLAGYASDILKRDFITFKKRTAVLFNNKPDPFDCYKYLIETHKAKGVKSLYFLLLGDYGINDKNHPASNLKFQTLIKHLSDYSSIGIHPSFGSTNNLHQLKVEISRLANISHKQVDKSRQHFSILKFPQTYQHLIQAGINEDYSMGYTNINGFRASFCYPFKWYNLDEEFVTSLEVHPFAISESTLKYFCEIEKKTFSEAARPYMDEVKKYNGELISIFHNNSFSDEMKTNYLKFLEAAK